MGTKKATTTAEWMRVLAPLTGQFDLSAADRKDLSFNVAEILSDVSVFMASPSSAPALAVLVSQMEHHWPFHQREVRRLAASRSTTSDRRRPGKPVRSKRS